MTTAMDRDTDAGRLDLVLTRTIDAPRAVVWAAWTDPEHLNILPDRRIVFSEVVDCDNRRLSASLITVEFEPEGGGTGLTLTDQIASLDGADMIAGSREGLTAALENLSRELRPEDPSA